MREPTFLSDGEVDDQRLPDLVEPLPPRVPRDRVLATGGMWWLALAVSLFLYGAGYLVWERFHG